MTDTGQLHAPGEAPFVTAAEARLAFVGGQLKWDRNDTAVLLCIERNTIRGHKRVRVLDITDISADGRPVFRVIDDTGTLIEAEERFLFTDLDLFGTKEEPSAYAKVIMARRDREARRAMTQPAWGLVLTLVVPDGPQPPTPQTPPSPPAPRGKGKRK